MLEGLGNLLQNKLILQYLAGLGADISAGRGLGENVNAITQQNIQSQNLMNLLKQMLGPDETKGSFDKTGMTLKVPNTNSLLSSILGGKESNAEDFYKGIGAMGPASIEPTTGGRRDIINPFVSSQPDISAADLAGLTSQDILAVMGVVSTRDQLRADSLYKQSLMNYYDAMTKGLEEPKIDPLDEIFDVVVPSLGRRVTLRQWKELPKGEQDYAIYLEGSKVIGDKKPMSKEEFQSLEPTEHEKLLRSFLKHPKLFNIEKQLRSAGATRISLGEKVSEKKTMSKLEGQLYFDNPKWTDDVHKYLGSDEVQRSYDAVPGKGQEYIKNKRRAELENTVNYIKSKIVAGGGTIVGRDKEDNGKTLVWTVIWPSGDTGKVRYTIK